MKYTIQFILAAIAFVVVIVLMFLPEGFFQKKVEKPAETQVPLNAYKPVASTQSTLAAAPITTVKLEFDASKPDGTYALSSRPSETEPGTASRAVAVVSRKTARPKPETLEADLNFTAEFIIQEGHSHDITDIEVDAQGKYIFTADKQGKIKMWEFATGLLIRNFSKDLLVEHGSEIEIDPMGKFVFSAGGQGDQIFKAGLKRWDFGSNQLIQNISSDKISDLALAVGGRYLADVGWKDLHVWDLQSQSQIGHMRSKYNWGTFSAVTVDPEGRYCYTGHTNGKISRWDIRSGMETVEVQGHNEDVAHLYIRPDKQQLISCGWKDGTIKVWHTENLQPVRTIRVQAPHSPRNTIFLNAIAADPNGRFLVSGGTDGYIHMWSLSDFRSIRRFDRPEIRMPDHLGIADVLALAVHPSGEYIISGGRKGKVWIWEVSTGKLIRKLSGEPTIAPHPQTGRYQRLKSKAQQKDTLTDRPIIVDVHKDLSHVLVKTNQDSFNLWDLKTGRMQMHFTRKEQVVYGLFGPKGECLLTADGSGYVRVWQLKTGALIKEFKTQHENRRIKWFDLDTDRRRLIVMLVSAGRFEYKDKNILDIWDYDSGALVNSISGCFDMQMDPRGRYLAGMYAKNRLGIWDLENGELSRHLTDFEGYFSRLTILQDGDVIVLGDVEHALHFWQVPSGRKLTSPDVGNHISKAIVIDPGGRFATYVNCSNLDFTHGTTRDTNRVLIGDRLLPWQPDTGYQTALRLFHKTQNYAREIPDYNMTAAIWDINAGKLTCRIQHKSEIIYTGIDPTGTFAVSASNQDIKIWRLSDGSLVHHLVPHKNFCLSRVNLDRSGRYILAGSCRGLNIWELASGKLINNLPDVGHQKVMYLVQDRQLSEQPLIMLVNRDDVCQVRELYSGESIGIGGIKQNVLLMPEMMLGPYVLSHSRYHANSLKLWHLSSGRHLTMVSGDREWLMYANDGYFDASRYGGSLVSMVEGLDVFGVDQFAIRNNRPDRMLTEMALGYDELVDHFYNRYQRRLRKSGFDEDQLSGELHAPDTMIVNAIQKGKTAELRFRLRDAHYPLKSYNIYVNNVPLFGTHGKRAQGREMDVTENIDLSSGKNKVEISCVNQQGVESYRALTYFNVERQVPGSLYYIGLGVSEYADPELNLKYAAKDARDLETVFRSIDSGYRGIYYRTLTNAEVNRRNLQRLKELLKTMTVDDTLVLFIAGHGLHDDDVDNTYYYLTHEARINNLAETAVSFDVIEDLLMSIAPRKKLLLMDTCESGEYDELDQERIFLLASSRGYLPRTTRAIGIIKSRQPNAVARPYLYDRNRYIYNELNRRSGTIVFSSSRGSELSYESDALENGFFSEALIEALQSTQSDKNRDGTVSVDEMRDAVVKKVALLSDGLQHPTIDRDNIYQTIAFPIVK